MIDTVRITSASNPIIKEIRALMDKKGRQESGLFLIEGYRLVKDALDSGGSIKYLIASDGFINKSGNILSNFSYIKLINLTDGLFERLSDTQSPQGLMAVAEIPLYDVESILQTLKKVIVLENIQDPGNLGTIIRTADACGFNAIILSKNCVDPYNSKVVRSTMGSLFHFPVLSVEDIHHTVKKLKNNGLKIAAAHIRDAIPAWEADLSDSVAIVIGNEGNGLTDEMLQSSDFAVIIPMLGKAESLNASAAASILLYESMRQQKG